MENRFVASLRHGLAHTALLLAALIHCAALARAQNLDALYQKAKAEGRMKNAEVGKSWGLESALGRLGAEACGNCGGPAKDAK